MWTLYDLNNAGFLPDVMANSRFQVSFPSRGE